jgi:plastocyanin
MAAVAKQGAASVRAGTKRRVATPTAKVSGVAQQAAKAAVALSAAVGVSTGAAFAGDHKVIAGADDGSLVFEPNEITIKAGETIDFVNNKAGPHNVQFEEDGVPSGVDPDSITYEGTPSPLHLSL